MQIVMEFLARVLFRGTGRHRAVTPPAPDAQRIPRLPALRSPRPLEVIEADGFPLVRPYILQHIERAQQQERCIALALATVGIDYPTEIAA